MVYSLFIFFRVNTEWPTTILSWFKDRALILMYKLINTAVSSGKNCHICRKNSWWLYNGYTMCSAQKVVGNVVAFSNYFVEYNIIISDISSCYLLLQICNCILKSSQDVVFPTDTKCPGPCWCTDYIFPFDVLMSWLYCGLSGLK